MKILPLKCVEQYRMKNKGRCLVFLSRQDAVLDNQQTEQQLQAYYSIVWDEEQPHKFKKSLSIYRLSKRSKTLNDSR
ncbi:YqiA/YcfP family alpha/beta fold hydrolase [Vibrio metschnikovii]